jgi:hypothetical protein
VARHSWAENHPIAIASIAWFLAALPGLISFILWFWNTVTCREPWLGIGFWRMFWIGGFDSTGPAIAAGVVSTIALRVCGPLGGVFTGRKDRSVVLLGLIVYFTSLLAALVLVIVARLLIMVLGTACS